MKKFYLVFFLTAYLFAQQDIAIRSLQTYTESIQSLPIISNGQSLKISFDVEAVTEPSLIIEFRFCDRNWVPYENVFLINQGFNTAYNLWFETIPVATNDIRYHYEDEFPNHDVKFPFSGKWKYFIKDSNNPDIIYEVGRFYVINEQMPVSVNLKQHRIDKPSSVNNALERTFELSADFNLPDSLYPVDLNYVEVIENQKLDYPIIISRDGYGKYRFYETDGNRNFTFFARDIMPGNEYRQTDLRDKNKFRPPLTNAQFDGIEYSRFYDFGQPDNNGGFRLVDFENEYADYMIVKFEFSPPNPDDNIFLVGSFTGWEVLPYNQLKKEGSVYTVSFELKRGIYDYQYVSGRRTGDEVTDIDWYIYEGNFWETTNDYYVFVYYKSQRLGGYDQIIGYAKIKSERL